MGVGVTVGGSSILSCTVKMRDLKLSVEMLNRIKMLLQEYIFGRKR